jgi:hypothetical protein
MKNTFVTSIASNLTKTMVKPTNFLYQNVREMANHRHKKILKLAKGFRGRANRCYTVAYHRVLKARQYAYRDRKVSLFVSVLVLSDDC